MQLIDRNVRFRGLGAAVLLIAGVASTAALAAPAGEAKALLRQELAVCASGASIQGEATCVHEARAAYAQNRRGALSDGDANYLSNVEKRCEVLEIADRAACVARIQGQGTTTGSVTSGGVYRELVIRDSAGTRSDKSPN